jgi:hypothetical protein
VPTGTEVVFGPRCGETGPINQALAMPGVTVAPDEMGEFDSTGLSFFRDVDLWRQAASGHFDPLGLDCFRDSPIWEVSTKPET